MSNAKQLLLDLSLKPNYSEDDYIKCPCNWEAIQWIERWPNWPMKMIAIYGEPGCGKTHLAHIWSKKANARYLTPMDAEIHSPLESTNNHNTFILDDADDPFLRENAASSMYEEWMFHFYNLLNEKGANLLICCQKPPTQWSIKLPDLRSRLSTILSVAVSQPDEEALQAVLMKLCQERGMILSPEIAEYIIRRIERSFNGIRTIVELLDHKTLTLHRQLTLGLVRDVLNDAAIQEI
jgi:DnaA regulatory inactivator Hda